MTFLNRGRNYELDVGNIFGELRVVSVIRSKTRAGVTFAMRCVEHGHIVRRCAWEVTWRGNDECPWCKGGRALSAMRRANGSPSKARNVNQHRWVDVDRQTMEGAVVVRCCSCCLMESTWPGASQACTGPRSAARLSATASL